MYLILKNTVTLGQYNGGVFCKQQMNISFPKKIVGLRNQIRKSLCQVR